MQNKNSTKYSFDTNTVSKVPIFYGAGKNAVRNLDKWVNEGIIPTCFCDADVSKHYTQFPPDSREVKFDILPLLEAITKYPDYILYLTQAPASVGKIASELRGLGIPDERIIPLIKSREFYLKSGDFQMIEGEGIFTNEFVKYVRENKPHTFCNIGAANGGYASIAGYFMDDMSEIYLFEPVPTFVESLHKLFASDKRVQIIDKAVSNINGTVELTTTIKANTEHIAHSFTMDRNQSMFASEYTEQDKTVKVTAQTVIFDDFIGNQDIDLILMDIEGAEVLALEGMEKLISKRKTTFFLEVHEPYIKALRPDGIEYINAIFKKYDYKIYWCELTEGGDYKSERGGVRVVPTDTIKWEHCILTPSEF